MVAFQEILLLSALQLLLGPEGGGGRGGPGQSSLACVLTRAAGDRHRTHAHWGPPWCQACAKDFTHPHVVPQPPREAVVVNPVSQRRLREEEYLSLDWGGLDSVLFYQKAHLPGSFPWAELGCLSFQEVGVFHSQPLMPGDAGATWVRRCLAGRCPAPSRPTPPGSSPQLGLGLPSPARKGHTPHGAKPL